MRLIRAPGKVFWIGEYAVLEGATAVVAAIERHVEIRVEDRPDRLVRFRAPDIPTLTLWDGSGRLLPDGVPAGAELIAAIAETVAESGSAPRFGLGICADSSALSASSAGGLKLGLGSSGAVAAGVVAALAPNADPHEIEALALEAHRRFQGGTGSGGDVLASLHGGLLAFARGERPSRLEAPEALQWAVLQTSRPADTRLLTRSFAAWRAAGEGESLIARLREISDAAVRALRAGDVDAWIAAIRDYVETERRVGDESGVPIIDQVVDACISAAEAAGWAAKPSGAGGGDIVIAFGAEDADRARLWRSLQRAGFDRIPLALEATGVLQSLQPRG